MFIAHNTRREEIFGSSRTNPDSCESLKTSHSMIHIGLAPMIDWEWMTGLFSIVRSIA
jgi:hypothetical protein